MEQVVVEGAVVEQVDLGVADLVAAEEQVGLVAAEEVHWQDQLGHCYHHYCYCFGLHHYCWDWQGLEPQNLPFYYNIAKFTYLVLMYLFHV